MNTVAYYVATAMLPHKIGYHPSPGQVGVLAVTDHLRDEALYVDGPCAVVPAGTPDQLRTAGRQIGNLTDTLTPGHEWLIVGYGEDGARAAQHLRAGLDDVAAPVLAETRVVERRIALIPDELRAIFPEGVVPNDDLAFADRSFSDYVDQEVISDLALHGRPAPAASRAEFLDRYRPLPEPLYPTPSPAEQARLDALPPSKRHELILTALDDFARNPRPDAANAGRAAYLMHTDKTLRDRVVVDALSDDSRVEALLQLYRGTDPTHRRNVAGAAAACAYMAGPTVVGTYQIAEDNPTDRLANLMAEAGAAGIPPTEVRTSFVEVIPSTTELDAQWQQQQQRANHSAAFPSPARDALKAPDGTTPTPKPRNDPEQGRDNDPSHGR